MPIRPPSDPADAAGDGDEPAELADQVGQQQDAGGGDVVAEGGEADAEHRDVEQHVARGAGDEARDRRCAGARSPRRRRRPGCSSPFGELRPAGARGPAGGRAVARRARTRSPPARSRPARCPSHGLGAAVQQPGPEPDAGEHEQGDVGEARDEEERDGAPGDVPRVHAAATQDPRAERQAARPADGDQRVRRQLRHADLEARAPAHPPAERRRERPARRTGTRGPAARRRRRASPAGRRRSRRGRCSGRGAGG